MVLTRAQQAYIFVQSTVLRANQPSQQILQVKQQNMPVNTAQVNYVLSPFTRNINLGDTQELKLYLQATKEIKKETKNDVFVSNAKDVVDHFLVFANKYGWACLTFRVATADGVKNIFWLVENISLTAMKNQAWRCFGLQVSHYERWNIYRLTPPMQKSYTWVKPYMGNTLTMLVT